MPGGIQSKKGPAGTAKNARFSRIFSKSSSRQSLLIYITQQDDRQRHCSSSHDGFGSPMQIQVFAQLNLARHCEPR